jgi:hypothetical protein
VPIDVFGKHSVRYYGNHRCTTQDFIVAPLDFGIVSTSLVSLCIILPRFYKLASFYSCLLV